MYAQSVNTFIITARECTRALNEARMERRPGARSWLACTADSLGVELRIAALKLIAWWSSFKVSWSTGKHLKGQLQAPTALPAGAAV